MSILAKYNAAMEAKDEAAMNEILHDDYKFIEGTEVSKPIMDEVLDSYSIYDLTKVK